MGEAQQAVAGGVDAGALRGAQAVVVGVKAAIEVDVGGGGVCAGEAVAVGVPAVAAV